MERQKDEKTAGLAGFILVVLTVSIAANVVNSCIQSYEFEAELRVLDEKINARQDQIEENQRLIQQIEKDVAFALSDADVAHLRIERMRWQLEIVAGRLGYVHLPSPSKEPERPVTHAESGGSLAGVKQ